MDVELCERRLGLIQHAPDGLDLVLALLFHLDLDHGARAEHQRRGGGDGRRSPELLRARGLTLGLREQVARIAVARIALDERPERCEDAVGVPSGQHVGAGADDPGAGFLDAPSEHEAHAKLEALGDGGWLQERSDGQSGTTAHGGAVFT